MDQVIIANLTILLGMIPVGILLGWGMLRGLDKMVGVKFREALKHMSRDPKAVAIYYSTRFAAVMYLVAALTGRFI
jgi:hypothetical protein